MTSSTSETTCFKPVAAPPLAHPEWSNLFVVLDIYWAVVWQGIAVNDPALGGLDDGARRWSGIGKVACCSQAGQQIERPYHTLKVRTKSLYFCAFT